MPPNESILFTILLLMAAFYTQAQNEVGFDGYNQSKSFLPKVFLSLE